MSPNPFESMSVEDLKKLQSSLDEYIHDKNVSLDEENVDEENIVPTEIDDVDKDFVDDIKAENAEEHDETVGGDTVLAESFDELETKTQKKKKKKKKNKKKKSSQVGDQGQVDDEAEDDVVPVLLSKASLAVAEEKLQGLGSGSVGQFAWEIVDPVESSDIPVLRFYDDMSDENILCVALTEKSSRDLRSAMSYALGFYVDERKKQRKKEQFEALNKLNSSQRMVARSKTMYKSAHQRFGLFATLSTVFVGLFVAVVLGISVVTWFMNSDLVYMLSHR